MFGEGAGVTNAPRTVNTMLNSAAIERIYKNIYYTRQLIGPASDLVTPTLEAGD